MERDPVRFVWRTSLGLNLAASALAILLAATAWIGLDILRLVIDDAVVGRAFVGGAPTAPFLHYELAFSERFFETPLVISPGLVLSRHDLALASILGLAAALVVAVLLAIVLGLIRVRIGERALAKLEDRILVESASAPSAAGEEVRQMALVAGDALEADRGAIGAAVGLPVLTIILMLVATFYVSILSVLMACLLLVGLGAVVLAVSRRDLAFERLTSAEAAAAAALRRAIGEVADHLKAIAAHGTADAEKRRVAEGLVPARAPVLRSERRLAVATALVLGSTLVAPVGVLCAGAWASLSGAIGPGEVVSAIAAASLAVGALRGYLRWRRSLGRLRPIFGEIARAVGVFHARRRGSEGTPLPGAGELALENVMTDHLEESGRLAGVDLAFALPAHVVVTGDRDSGARAFAALLGGQVQPVSGHVTLGGVDLAASDPADRAVRLAYCGGEPLLFSATLRANLTYGLPDEAAHDLDARLREAVTVAGLDEFVRARGLTGHLDLRHQPALAEAVIAARSAVRVFLDGRGLSDLVEPFDPDVYNAQATIGENILFGVPLGDTFHARNLPSHPFMRGLLEEENLTKTLAALGAAMARTTLEMFADLPARGAVGQFAFFAAGEREAFGRLLSRQADRRGASQRDSERLIGLALRYSETRHRLGLLGPDLRSRLVRLRAQFASRIPKSLGPAVEFLHPDRICAAATIRDNLLFGRIAEERAGGAAIVEALIQEILSEAGLQDAIFRTGLDARFDPAAEKLARGTAAAIDLVRCLVRRPDNLVVERALDDLPSAAATAMLGRLRGAMAGRGLVVVLPDTMEVEPAPDRRIGFLAGKPEEPSPSLTDAQNGTARLGSSASRS